MRFEYFFFNLNMQNKNGEIIWREKNAKGVQNIRESYKNKKLLFLFFLIF